MTKIMEFPQVKTAAYAAGHAAFFAAVEEDGIPDEVIPPTEYANSSAWLAGWDAGLEEFKAHMRQVLASL